MSVGDSVSLTYFVYSLIRARCCYKLLNSDSDHESSWMCSLYCHYQALVFCLLLSYCLFSIYCLSTVYCQATVFSPASVYCSATVCLLSSYCLVSNVQPNWSKLNFMTENNMFNVFCLCILTITICYCIPSQPSSTRERLLSCGQFLVIFQENHSLW